MTDVQRPRPFHERFGIEVGMVQARQRFMNRVSLLIFDSISTPKRQVGRRLLSAGPDIWEVCTYVAYHLGDAVESRPDLKRYVGGDFDRCLLVLEALYQFLQDTDVDLANWLSDSIDGVLYSAEVDLGVRWQPPVFVPTGARLLDDRLVNDPLHWLDEPKYSTVYDPFKNGLSHFRESQKKPHLLKDVVTDMYEAVEGLAKVVTGRFNEDLSANRQLFVKSIKASKSYKRLIDQLLKDYIAYASDFRHAEDRPGARPVPSRAEVESFIYLTGLFIRLAVQERE